MKITVRNRLADLGEIADNKINPEGVLSTWLAIDSDVTDMLLDGLGISCCVLSCLALNTLGDLNKLLLLEIQLGECVGGGTNLGGKHLLFSLTPADLVHMC